MKRQISIILIFFFFPLIVFSHCSYIKSCKDQCKNKTNDCALKNIVVSRAITSTTTSSSSSSSSSSTTTTTGSEVEPNDTFQDSYKSAFNGIRGSVGQSYIQNATISASTDIDIFDSSESSGNSNIATQLNNLDKVTCNVYLKNDSTVRNANTRLQTPTSSPDSSFVFQGKLNPSFSFPSTTGTTAVVYFICSGTANTAYSIQVTGISKFSTSGSSFASSYFDYTAVSSCKDATKTCETKCSRSF